MNAVRRIDRNKTRCPLSIPKVHVATQFLKKCQRQRDSDREKVFKLEKKIRKNGSG